jgi:NADH dehydrogenase FAD-containing subunit
MDGKYVFIQAQIQSLNANSVKLSRAFPEHGIESDTLDFDYAVYALGSHLPSPLNLWHASPDGKPAAHSYEGNKAESIAWLRGKQRTIEDATSVLVVGGGALGIRMSLIIVACPARPHP